MLGSFCRLAATGTVLVELPWLCRLQQPQFRLMFLYDCADTLSGALQRAPMAGPRRSAAPGAAAALVAAAPSQRAPSHRRSQRPAAKARTLLGTIPQLAGSYSAKAPRFLSWHLLYEGGSVLLEDSTSGSEHGYAGTRLDTSVRCCTWQRNLLSYLRQTSVYSDLQ